MNLLLTYLGFIYLRIIGDFSNTPESFKDKDMANKLMSFNRTPRQGQGFLVQVNIDQEDLARRLVKAAKFGKLHTNLNSNDSTDNNKSVDTTPHKDEKERDTEEEEKDEVNQTTNDNSSEKDDNNKADDEVEKDKTSEEEKETPDNAPQEVDEDQKSGEEDNSETAEQLPAQNDENNKSDENENTETDDEEVPAQNDEDQVSERLLSLKKRNSLPLLSNRKEEIYNRDLAEKLDYVPIARSYDKNNANGTNTDTISANNNKEEKTHRSQKTNVKTQTELGKTHEEASHSDLSKDKDDVLLKSGKEDDKNENKAVEAAKTGLHVLFLLAILFLLIIYVIIFFKYSIWQFYYEIAYAIANGYSEFIEKQGITKELPEKRIKLLNSLKWVIYDLKEIEVAKNVTEVEEFQGIVYDFDIKMKERINYILAVPPASSKKKKTKKPSDFYYSLNKEDTRYVYYEIETEYIHDSTEVIIGYDDSSNMEEQKIGFPGQRPKSIGYNVKTGEVYINGSIVHTFNFSREIRKIRDDEFNSKFDYNGSFFGIGVNLKNNLAFFTFNGRILNSLPFQTASEIRYKIYKYKRDDIIESDDTTNIKKVAKLNTLMKRLDLEKEQRDDIKNMLQFSSSVNNYVPGIYITGACKLRVNVGGSVFQIREKILELGLLRKKS